MKPNKVSPNWSCCYRHTAVKPNTYTYSERKDSYKKYKKQRRRGRQVQQKVSDEITVAVVRVLNRGSSTGVKKSMFE